MIEHVVQITPTRARIDAGWDDAPHLDDQTKAEMLAAIPPHQREARSKGIPGQGDGAIYEMPDEWITCDPFPIPANWKRGYGLDVGWNWTGAVWIAEDPNDLVHYLYAEHKVPNADPVRHAAAIKARGKTLRGAIDPAANQSNQKDGEKLMTIYRNQGLNLVNAVNDVEAGLTHCWQMLSEGRLKIFTTCRKTLQERRHYHRKRKTDKDGVERSRIIKRDDHLMDPMRYCEMTWDQIARPLTDNAVMPQAPQRVPSGSGL